MKLQGGAAWVWGQLTSGFWAAKGEAERQGTVAADRVVEGATYASNRAQEKKLKAEHKLREEL